MENNTPPTDVNDSAKKAIAVREKKNEEARTSLSGIVKRRAVELWGEERGQQFASALISASDRNSKIKQCTPESILSAAMACVAIDLVPETPEQYAYLIPYGNKIQFQIGYKGLIELAYRSDQIASINAELVFADETVDANGEIIPADEFTFTLGTDRGIYHVPNMNRDRTNIKDVTHVYATATLKDGDPSRGVKPTTVFDVMSLSEIRKIRESAKAKSTDSPWNMWWEAMAKKTVVKRLLTYLPKSSKDNRLTRAVAYDSWAEAGKLAYKNDELVNEAVVVEDSIEQEQSRVRVFAKPIEAVEEEKADASALIVKIEAKFAELGTSNQDQMNVVKEYTNSPFIKNAHVSDLERLLDHLEDISKDNGDQK